MSAHITPTDVDVPDIQPDFSAPFFQGFQVIASYILAGTVFHRIVVFNQQSRNVATSLRKGDSVIVAGDLRFGTYTDKETGQTRETRDIVADNIGASLKFASVSVDRAPKASGPAADRSATGPVAEPVSSTGVGVVR